MSSTLSKLPLPIYIEMAKDANPKDLEGLAKTNRDLRSVFNNPDFYRRLLHIRRNFNLPPDMNIINLSQYVYIDDFLSKTEIMPLGNINRPIRGITIYTRKDFEEIYPKTEQLIDNLRLIEIHKILSSENPGFDYYNVDTSFENHTNSIYFDRLMEEINIFALKKYFFKAATRAGALIKFTRLLPLVEGEADNLARVLLQGRDGFNELSSIYLKQMNNRKRKNETFANWIDPISDSFEEFIGYFYAGDGFFYETDENVRLSEVLKPEII